MRILLTGSGGMLGPYVGSAFRRGGNEVVATDLRASTLAARWPGIRQLDVCKPRAVHQVMAEVRPDIVVHMAAETSLEVCSDDPGHAYRTNVTGTAIVASAAAVHGAVILYVSSAGVFDGRKSTTYAENDQPSPVNTYGLSKYLGEMLVSSLCERHYVVRAGWMMGGGKGVDHKFVAHIMAQLESGATTIFAVSDQTGTPTYAPAFAERIVPLVLSGRFGIYHMACEGVATRFDVARRIVAGTHHPGVEVVPVTAKHFASEFPATRPASEALSCVLLDKLGIPRLPAWEHALDEYLLEWANDSLTNL